MRATDEACLCLSYPDFCRGLDRKEMLEILKTCFCNRYPGSIGEEGSEAHLAYERVQNSVLIDEFK